MTIEEMKKLDFENSEIAILDIDVDGWWNRKH